MRAYININQKAFSELATLKDTKIDLIDATIFEYIFKFAVSNKATKQLIDNKLFVWCSYQKIIDDNPLLNINTKKAIELRLNKLIDIGLFEKFTDKREGNKTYFNVTNLAYKLIIENVSVSNEDYQPLVTEITKLSNEDYQHLSNEDYYNSKLDNSKLNNKKINKKSEIVEYLKTLNLERINKKSLNEWLDYKNWDYKRLGINKILSFLDKYSFEVQQEIVDNSIMNNYKGLFEPKGNNKKLNSNSNDTDEWTVV